MTPSFEGQPVQVPERHASEEEVAAPVGKGGADIEIHAARAIEGDRGSVRNVARARNVKDATGLNYALHPGKTPRENFKKSSETFGFLSPVMARNTKVAVVTGAGSGIGRAVALGLLAEGYKVVLAGRRAGNLDTVITEAGSHEGRALAVPTDVRDPEAVRALFARTVSAFGRLDLVFNNAGVNAPGIPLEDLDYESWRAVLDTSVTGAFLCTQEAFKIMKSQVPRGGRIINNGSISAHVPRPDSAAYTAAKHAVTGLTRSTSLDGRKYDIACGQIDIGNARTELAERMSRGVKQAGGEVAAEPMMDVEHAAKAVLFMAGLPLEANVQFLTVLATKMPFIGRG